MKVPITNTCVPRSHQVTRYSGVLPNYFRWTPTTVCLELPTSSTSRRVPTSVPPTGVESTVPPEVVAVTLRCVAVRVRVTYCVAAAELASKCTLDGAGVAVSSCGAAAWCAIPAKLSA